MTLKQYLGDSVYIERDDAGRIKLTTNNGYADDPRNVIYVDESMIVAMVDWVRNRDESDRCPVCGQDVDG